ncbi:uncharacterized protein [Periplaneta americana]|uniref:uncharacterized protein n=1 Tax=Periplaneta americana TaxID=6978 RepID=UPI0037E86A0C
MMYRILFLSFLTFACLKDNILAQKNASGRTKVEELKHIIAITEKFPAWGTEIANNLTSEVGTVLELITHLKGFVQGMKENNATVEKMVYDHMLRSYDFYSPFLDVLQKFTAEGREVLEIFKNYAHTLNKD